MAALAEAAEAVAGDGHLASVDRNQLDAELGDERVEFGDAGGAEPRHDQPFPTSTAVPAEISRPTGARGPGQQHVRGWLLEQDGDQRRAVDDDHCGRPSAS